MVATSRDGSVSFHHQRWRTESEKTRRGIEEPSRTPGNKRVTFERIPRTPPVAAAQDRRIRLPLHALRSELQGHRNGTKITHRDANTERNRNGNSSAFTEIRPSIRRTAGQTFPIPRAGGGRSSQNTKTARYGTEASPRRPVGVTVREGYPHPSRVHVPLWPRPCPVFRTSRNTGIPHVRLSTPPADTARRPRPPVAWGVLAVSCGRARRAPTQGMDASPVRLGAPVRRTSRRREQRPLLATPPCTHGTEARSAPGRASVMERAPDARGGRTWTSGAPVDPGGASRSPCAGMATERPLAHDEGPATHGWQALAFFGGAEGI